ncbi:hypothetical protein PHK61_10795 [Actinomycetospora lutea]|uniref:hypothetical protein n=1 Tax=Actinomycetospora lutea TaxID=663604 RepID=UPI002366E33C|nr:hypothetical protein [Actinomycetospora lutea]MDD7938905.1 hypothetical protein [Actinomycetospora lutea]
MSSDDTPVVALRQATSALRAGTVTRELDAEDLGMLGVEARALVEQLLDVLQSVDRATTDPRDPHTRDLGTLRRRLASALAPVDVASGDPRDGIDEEPVPARPGRPDD